MLNLIRYKATEDALLGRLYLNGAFLCHTLENKKKAVPCGIYNVENSKSPKFGRELPLIYNAEVPAKRGIRIHVGNVVANSDGCVLVGMGCAGERLTESKLAEQMVTMICRNSTELVISET